MLSPNRKPPYRRAHRFVKHPHNVCLRLNAAVTREGYYIKVDIFDEFGNSFSHCNNL